MNVKWLVVLLCLSSAVEGWAASLIRLDLETYGSMAPPGDRLKLSILFAPGEHEAEIEVRAYEAVEGEDADGTGLEIRRIAGRDDAFRDAGGGFCVVTRLTVEGEERIGETAIVVPYDNLELPVGRHRIGYELRVLLGGEVDFTTATALSFLEVLERPAVVPRQSFVEEQRVAVAAKREPVFVVQPDGTIERDEDTLEEPCSTTIVVASETQVTSAFVRPPIPVVAGMEQGGPVFANMEDGDSYAGRMFASKRWGALTFLDKSNRARDLEVRNIRSIALMQPAGAVGPASESVEQDLVAELNQRPWVPEPHVQIHFATNRRLVKPASREPDRFGDEIARLRYGSCLVSIPLAVHRRGQLERPRWWESPDPKKHILVEAVSCMADDTFLEMMKRALGNDGNDILVFVHGYANAFENCVLTGARLKHDTEFAGPVVVFAWPSEGKTFNWLNPSGPYRRDEAKAKASYGALAECFAALIRQRDAAGRGEIHVLAHSMGSRIVLEALRTVDERLNRDDRPFGHVIFAAPDVDVRTFVEAFPSVSRLSDDVTLYYCEDDVALKTSQGIHMDSRMGQYRLKMDGLHNIDCKNANTSWIGHGYVVDRDMLLVDLQMLLTQDLSPPQRRPPLRENMFRNWTYWYFPQVGLPARRRESREAQVEVRSAVLGEGGLQECEIFITRTGGQSS